MLQSKLRPPSKTSKKTEDKKPIGKQKPEPHTDPEKFKLYFDFVNSIAYIKPHQVRGGIGVVVCLWKIDCDVRDDLCYSFQF